MLWTFIRYWPGNGHWYTAGNGTAYYVEEWREQNGYHLWNHNYYYYWNGSKWVYWVDYRCTGFDLSTSYACMWVYP